MAKKLRITSAGYAGILDGQLHSLNAGDVIEVEDKTAKYLLSDESPGTFEVVNTAAEEKAAREQKAAEEKAAEVPKS